MSWNAGVGENNNTSNSFQKQITPIYKWYYATISINKVYPYVFDEKNDVYIATIPELKIKHVFSLSKAMDKVKKTSSSLIDKDPNLIERNRKFYEDQITAWISVRNNTLSNYNSTVLLFDKDPNRSIESTLIEQFSIRTDKTACSLKVRKDFNVEWDKFSSYINIPNMQVYYITNNTSAGFAQEWCWVLANYYWVFYSTNYPDRYIIFPHSQAVDLFLESSYMEYLQ